MLILLVLVLLLIGLAMVGNKLVHGHGCSWWPWHASRGEWLGRMG